MGPFFERGNIDHVQYILYAELLGSPKWTESWKEGNRVEVDWPPIPRFIQAEDVAIFQGRRSLDELDDIFATHASQRRMCDIVPANVNRCRWKR